MNPYGRYYNCLGAVIIIPLKRSGWYFAFEYPGAIVGYQLITLKGSQTLMNSFVYMACFINPDRKELK